VVCDAKLNAINETMLPGAPAHIPSTCLMGRDLVGSGMT
jgi:hypothetical protein